MRCALALSVLLSVPAWGQEAQPEADRAETGEQTTERAKKPPKRTVSVQIKGIEGELLDNVKAHLGDIENSRAHEVRRRLKRAVDAGLRAYGYYSPTVQVHQNRDDKRNVELVADVQAGEQVKLTDADVQLTGQAADNPEFVRTFANIPKAGTPLHHGTYEAFKDEVLALSLSHGYFEGRFTQKALEVSADQLLARWKLHYDSGPQYKIGRITYVDSQIDPAYLRPLEPVAEGDPYDHAALAEINRKLSDTGWFASVALQPDFAAAKADPEKKLPVNVLVTPRKRNIVETGVGYASDIGPHAKLKWTRPWSNSRGHSWSATADVSSKEQSLDFSYRIPSQTDPLGDYWLIQSGYKYTDLNDTISSQFAGSLSRFEALESGWVRQISLNALWDNYTQGETKNTALIVYPGIAFSRTRTRGGTDAHWGDAQRWAVHVSNGLWGSDTDFVLLEGTQTWLRTFANKHRVVLRASMGWIETDDFEGVPPDLRFFAGGDMSVRGYRYESISPKDDSGKLTGGSKMFTGSFEYQYNVTGVWWAAAFFDAGDAVRSMDDWNLKKGAGLGVRWASPIGPLKFDIAVPLGNDVKRKLHFYIGLGGVL